MTSRIGSPDTETDERLRSRLSSSESRHFVMVAGAGSGKTTSLVKALAFLETSQGATLRRKSQKIACITFTDVAVNEIRGDVGNDELYHVSTIHSFLWAVIKPFHDDLREWVRSRLNEKIAENIEKIDKPRTQQRTKDSARRENERYARQLGEIDAIKNFRYGTGSDYSNGVLGHSDILKIGPDFIQTKALMRKLIARRYPIIFVDESQDTDPNVVEALRALADENRRDFCVGFFGDPVQKIYMQGAGAVPIEEGWCKLEKPENFRCPQSVLKVINRIREEDDGLQQTGGRRAKKDGKLVPIQGSARVLIMPDDEHRYERLHQARIWLAEQDNDGSWLIEDDEDALKLLVLVHRVAAERLGFANLYAALNDKSTESLKSGLTDGTVWVVRPLLQFVLPVLLATEAGEEFSVMRLVRKYCPKLDPDLLDQANTPEILKSVKNEIEELAGLLSEGAQATIGDILTFLRKTELFQLDERFESLIDDYCDSPPVSDPQPENAELRFLQCSAQELWGYRTYIEKLSPFATQQGVKGAEFEKVLVVVDDKERQLPGYSYGKYFGVTPLSDRDDKNLAEGKDSVLDRTRRLFYVCCSRARSDLVVAVFSDNVKLMKEAVIAKGFFEADAVHVVAE